MTPHLDSHSTADPEPEIISAVLTRVQHDKRNLRGIERAHIFREDDILVKDSYNIMRWGRVIMGLGATIEKKVKEHERSN